MKFGLISLIPLLVAGIIFAKVAALAESAAAQTNNRPTVVIVIGAPGEETFEERFDHWAEVLEKTCDQAGAKRISIGLKTEGQTNDWEVLKQTLANESKESDDELWVVLIGHGTFDGKDAKFNLRGPDLSATDLAGWLEHFRRPTAIVNCASSSAPFLAKLSRPERVVITATKSGYEQNYARFGQYFAEAIGDSSADLDKDGQTSLLEAFLTASRRVAEFYETEGRLATEHALLDDNGDGRGTPADWFRGVRAIKRAADGASPDGLRAHQFHLVRSAQERELSPAIRARRDHLEIQIENLRNEKGKMNEEDYYRQLEPLLLDLARLYESAKGPQK